MKIFVEPQRTAALNHINGESGIRPTVLKFMLITRRFILRVFVLKCASCIRKYTIIINFQFAAGATKLLQESWHIAVL